MAKNFPSSFLWGAALSSYQCEGNNFNCDWYLWEKEKNLPPAGAACDHYRLFEQDFELASLLNLNCLRFSIEWSRINPQPGVVSSEHLLHYQKVVDSLRKNGLKPIVTLHHFTNPIWFYQNGGWLNAKNVDFFLRYVQEAVSFLKEKVDTWIILNEPMVYVYNGFLKGIWPPGIKNINSARKAAYNILTAHQESYRLIKKTYAGISKAVNVGIAKHFRYFSPCPESKFNQLPCLLADKIFNFSPLEGLLSKRCLDFIGVNYYCKAYMQVKNFFPQECNHGHIKDRRNKIGWYIYPQGLLKILLRLKEYSLPVLITENGTSEDEDSLYENYLTSHLFCVSEALSSGVNILGYIWWSLIDNFEWERGWQHRFGLAELNFKTFERKIKPFAHVYAKICKENQI